MFKSHYDCRGANGPCALQYHNTRLFFSVSEAMNIWTTPSKQEKHKDSQRLVNTLNRCHDDDVVVTLTCDACNNVTLMLHVMCDV